MSRLTHSVVVVILDLKTLPLSKKRHESFDSTNPTKGRLPDAVKILNQVKQGHPVTIQDLLCLRDLIDNSLVATSKLLHFINPNACAIWDSRVYRFINGKSPFDYQSKAPNNYLAYLTNCQEIMQNKEFPQLHESMNKKIGYCVSPFRAIELVMYMNGGE
jgi:hypothetical protein